MKIFGKIPLIDAFKNRREPEAVHALADVIWHTLLIVTTVSTIAVIAYAFWEFTDVDRALSVQSATPTGAAVKLPFEKKELQTVIEGFAMRRATYELYSSTTAAVLDPFEIKKEKPAR